MTQFNSWPKWLAQSSFAQKLEKWLKRNLSTPRLRQIRLEERLSTKQ